MSTNTSKVFLNENGTQVYLKKCKHHGLTEFYNNDKKCILCTKERSLKRTDRKKKLQKIVNYLGGGCVYCGYNKCNRALDCHHLNPDEKEYTISQICNRKWSFIEQEIKKCILLCSNCHRSEHSKIIIKEDYYNNKRNWKYRKLLHNFNGNKCFICNNNNIYNAIYHHIDPTTKSFNISDGICKGYPLQDIIEENKKCVLLCSNCHREYHSGNFHQEVEFISTLDFNKYIKYLQEEQDKKKQPIECEGCGILTFNDKFCSHACNNQYKKRNNPSKEELEMLIQDNTYANIGKMFNVSGNAVKKWIKFYDLKYIPKKSKPPKKEYKPLLTKEELIKELTYLSINKIAKKYNTCKKTISKMCKYYDIKSTHINQYMKKW